MTLRTAVPALAVLALAAVAPAASASHECAGVGGSPGSPPTYGVCLSDDPPEAYQSELPVNSPTRVCYVVDCIENGQRITTLPFVKVDSGTVIWVCYSLGCARIG